MRTFDGGRGRLPPPVTVMNNQQLTMAAHNASSAIKQLQDLYEVGALERLEKKAAMVEAQLRALMVANRVQKCLIMQLAGLDEVGFHALVAAEQAKFAAEMSTLQQAQIEQQIKAAEQTLQQGVSSSVRAAISSQVAGFRAQLAFLRGETHGLQQQSKDETEGAAGGGGQDIAQGLGGGATAPEKITGVDQGQGIGDQPREGAGGVGRVPDGV